MAKHYTGIDGALYADGNKVARVSAWTFDGNVASLPTTTLGDYAATSVYGIQSYSGSCTIYYYEKDAGAVEGSLLMTDAAHNADTNRADA